MKNHQRHPNRYIQINPQYCMYVNNTGFFHLSVSEGRNSYMNKPDTLSRSPQLNVNIFREIEQ